MKFLITALLLLISSLAQADTSVVTSVGCGKAILEGGSGIPFERTFQIGVQKQWGDFFIRPQFGWFLALAGDGLSSAWVTNLFGVRAISAMGPELHLAIGPSYLFTPDGGVSPTGRLSGHFQFNLEGGAGLSSDDNKTYVGLVYVHLSNAGIVGPINQGRDFLEVQVRWSI